MSRYDYRDPGTDPAYCDGLRADDDTDVPDFDQPDPLMESRDVLDPAERAAHTLIDALTTLEQEIVKTTDLERAHFLKGLIKRHAQHADAVDLKASEVIDRIVERRR